MHLLFPSSTKILNQASTPVCQYDASSTASYHLAINWFTFQLIYNREFSANLLISLSSKQVIKTIKNVYLITL